MHVYTINVMCRGFNWGSDLASALRGSLHPTVGTFCAAKCGRKDKVKPMASALPQLCKSTILTFVGANRSDGAVVFLAELDANDGRRLDELLLKYCSIHQMGFFTKQLL